MTCLTMPESTPFTQGVKRSTSDIDPAHSAPSNSKRLRVDRSPETSTRRDAKKRKKRRKKEPVVVKLDHRHMQDTSSQPQRPPVSAHNQIIRFTSPQPSGSSTRVQVPSDGPDIENNPEGKLQSAILVCPSIVYSNSSSSLIVILHRKQSIHLKPLILVIRNSPQSQMSTPKKLQIRWFLKTGFRN